MAKYENPNVMPVEVPVQGKIEPSSENVTPEEMAALKEKYISFIRDTDHIRTTIEQMSTRLTKGEEESVLSTWPKLKPELESLHEKALALNKGDFGSLVQEQLEEILRLFSDLQSQVISYEPKASREEKAQKAHKAYTKQ